MSSKTAQAKIANFLFKGFVNNFVKFVGLNNKKAKIWFSKIQNDKNLTDRIFKSKKFLFYYFVANFDLF